MSATDKFPSHAVAIVGLAGRFPGARDLEGFWDNLKQGVESLEPFSDADLDASGIAPGLRSNPNYVRSGTVLEGADLFDAAFFGLSPREAQIIDPQQRIFLECAWEALEHAGYAPGTFEQAVGVYGGATMNTYLISQILRDPALVAAVGGYQLMLGNDKDFLCTRVSYKLDLHGPSMTIQTACSTSLVAVQVACRALERHECDIALAGGVSVSFPQRGGYLYQEGMILSPDGRCRPFDADARGTRPGAGCGIVVLKRLAEALADGDTIHAVIRGAAINNDGAGKAGFTAPSVDGQVEAIATAQMLAGVDPRSIGYIEAHGTGTPLGDPIEIAALTQVFRAATPDLGFCRLGSLKGNLGHLDAAAGVAGLIKAVLALQHREIPPLLHFTQPNPQLDLEHSPFAASAAGSPWPAGATPRRAGVSSFGIGGTNAHVVIEEAPPVEAGPPARDAQLLVLSARSEEALDAATQRLVAHLETHPEQALADVAWTLQIGRRAFAHRRTVVVHGAAQAIERLGQPQRAPVHSAVHEGGDRPVAFLFSGQGSQHAGMGAGLYRSEPAYRDAIDRCAALLREPLGLDLRDVLFAPAGDGAINQTRLAQPALFATSYALAMLWQQWGLRPAAMLGHSIGEYVAAHLAGVMSLDDALSLVAARGQLMQAMPPGGMAAVHLGADELLPWLAASAGVEIAAVNAPGLCTIAGPADALAGCLARLQAGGIETRALHTSHAFHSAMMAPVLAPFTALVGKVALSAPTIPYVSNVTGQWITPQQATSPAYYAEHLRSPVMFAQGLRTLAADPGLHLLEVGPGNVLASLARLGLLKDGPGRVGASLGAVRDDSGECPAMLEALARLWRAGVPLDWAGTRGDTRPRRVPLPTYPFERKRHWVEARNEVPAEPAWPAARTPRAEPVAERGVDDFFWEPTWQRSLKLSQLHPSPGQAPGRWLVFHDGSATAQAVVEALQAQGTDVTAVLPAAAFEQAAPDRFGIVPDRAEDYERLLDAVVGADDRLDCIAHLWNVSAPVDGVDALADAASGRAMGFYSLLYLAQALGRRTRSSPLPVLAVTSDRESVLGVEPVRPGRSLLVGPAYLMPIDVPSLHCRTIDLWGQEWQPSSAAGLATCLRAEAGRSGSEPVVAYRGAYRWAPLLRPRTLKIHDDVLPLRQGGTYLVTGGTGGIGLTLASYLATTWRARLVLTSRSALPERGEWERLIADERTEPALKARLRGVQQIEALGTEVMLCVADVCDEARMAAAVQSATARFGAIHGVVHAAGLLGAGTMLEKSASGIEAVLRPKVEGTLVLDRVLAGQGLDFLLLCSSISTAFGSTGMGDYSAANAFQDAFAKSGLARSTNRVISVGWDAWREVGFAASLGDGSAHAALRHAIRPQEGVEAMRRILASELPHVYVTSQDMPEMLRNVEALAQWMRDAGQRAVVDANPAQPRPMATTPVAGASDIEGRIAAIWTELLGVEDIDPAADFFELGGHSLLATRVLTRIEESTHVRLTLRDIFDAPTLRMLAERVSHAAEAHEDREEIEF